MINYKTFKHKTSTQWVTFIHGAGGSSSIWYKQIKAFRKEYNILLVDLRGHGTSNLLKNFQKKYTFKSITKDVLEVLDHLKIKKSHFVGISLGTIIIRQLAEFNPTRVKSMIMGGAVLKINFRSKILMNMGNIFKHILPYLTLYKILAYTIMPKKSHKESRLLFINEAKKMCQKEFLKWFKLTAELTPVLNLFKQPELNIPTLYIMGNEDHMFLPTVQHFVHTHFKMAQLSIIKKAGHIVNVDQPTIFNEKSLDFIKTIK